MPRSDGALILGAAPGSGLFYLSLGVQDMISKRPLGLVMLAALTACDDNGSSQASPTADAVVTADASTSTDIHVPDPVSDAARDVDPSPHDTALPAPDGTRPQPDAALSDVAPIPDAAPILDATPIPDAAPIDVTLPDIAWPDLSVPDAVPPDAEPPFIWPQDRPTGQCTQANDCPSGICQRNPPGGICMAGGGCPEGTVSSGTGACNRQCELDQLCPVGLFCRRGFGGEWFCGIPSCDHDDDCEGPYICRDDFCARPPCGAEMACPAQMICAGGLCMEPE